MTGVEWALNELCKALGFSPNDVVELHASPKNLTVVYRDETDRNHLRVASQAWRAEDIVVQPDAS